MPGVPRPASMVGDLSTLKARFTVQRSVPAAPPGGDSTTGTPLGVRVTAPLASQAEGVTVSPAQAVPAGPVAGGTLNTPRAGVEHGLVATPEAPHESVTCNWVSVLLVAL